MVFGTGRRNAREKDDDPQESRRVPYRLASYEHDLEGRKFKSTNVVYSFWSAVKYIFVISLILWWLPMFGQMIAGYVGGRRAGSPWKGVAASIIPVICMYTLTTAFENNILPTHVAGVAIAPGAIGAFISTHLPFLAPYVTFSSEYVGSFVDSLSSTSPYGINTYVLTVAFAYVGGVLAQQNRREIEFSSGAVMNNTTVLVHDPSGHSKHQGIGAPEHQGVFASIGGALHLTGRHDGNSHAASGGFLSHRRDPWGQATTMQYDGGMDDQFLLPAGDGTGYEDFPETSSGGRMRKHGHRDSWHHRQKRRGAPNYSAKPRVNYDQYADVPGPDYEAPPRKRRFLRRPKEAYRMTVAPSARSIRKVERMINAEWNGGHRRSPRFSQGYAAEAEEAEEETEAVAVAEPRRRENHNSPHQWDSI